ncbi:MAG TPA: hypothetical protein VFA60_06655 [Terriglobales bacterium]|nr:hypothetical protein [Terriglobales bacterium]
MKKRLISISIIASGVVLCASCGLLGGGGSSAVMTITTPVVQVGLMQPQGEANVNFDGLTLNSQCDSQGLVTNIGIQLGIQHTDSSGQKRLSEVCVPSSWSFHRFQSPHCNHDVFTSVFVNNGSVVPLTCTTVGQFSISPGSSDAFSLPSSYTVSGQGFSAVYGMPRIDFYSYDGVVYTSAYATWVSADGTTLTFNTPAISPPLVSGEYQILISNATGGGNYDPMGGVILQITGNDPPPPDSGGGGGESCSGGHCPDLP